MGGGDGTGATREPALVPGDRGWYLGTGGQQLLGSFKLRIILYTGI